MKPPGPGAPPVPRSQEEIDQDAEDARRDEAEQLAAARARAMKDNWRLLRLAAALAVLATGASWLFAPAVFAHGMAAGCAVMLVNLWGMKVLLARIVFGDPRKGLFAVLLVAKFGALAGLSLLLIRAYPDTAMGFGLGLGIPALAGMLWSAVGSKGRAG